MREVLITSSKRGWRPWAVYNNMEFIFRIIYAQVALLDTIKMLLALAIKIYQLDVKYMFLNGTFKSIKLNP